MTKDIHQRPFVQILLSMVLGNTARSKNFIGIFLCMRSFILQFFTITIVILYLSLLFRMKLILKPKLIGKVNYRYRNVRSMNETLFKFVFFQ